MERRLTAILVADVVDYTRLMSEDEAGTLVALNALRQDLFEPKIADANGKIIKRMGDGWIVEFANVSGAVACAISVQESLLEHDLFRLRIAVHIGDVTFQEDDIYGDGINVAARLNWALATGSPTRPRNIFYRSRTSPQSRSYLSTTCLQIQARNIFPTA